MKVVSISPLLNFTLMWNHYDVIDLKFYSKGLPFPNFAVNTGIAYGPILNSLDESLWGKPRK